MARIDADLDGDGSYETTDLFAAGEDAVASHSYRDPGPGMQTVHARVVDDAGAVGLVSAQVQVHVGNLDPFAGLSASVAGDRVSLTAAARDPEGAEPGYLWDLDGDGVYELDTAGVASASGSVPGAGSHEVGVRVLDGFGGETTVRRTVFVGSGAALDVVVPDAPVRPGAPASFTAVAGPGATVDWDLDGDGEFDDGSGLEATHTYAAPGAYPVRARARGAGALGVAAGTGASAGAGGFGAGRGAADERVELRTVVVRADEGLMPVVDELALPAVVRAGRPATFRAAASDPDGGDVALAFDLDGDGAFDDVPSRAADGSYRWTFTAPADVAVRATDDGGHTADRTATVVPVEQNLPPELSLTVGRSRPACPRSRPRRSKTRTAPRPRSRGTPTATASSTTAPGRLCR